MLDSTPTTPAPDALPPTAAIDVPGRVPTLFRHTKREQWGLAIVRRKLDDRLQMQFQDGRQRTFKLGYYHFLDAVDRQLDVTLGIVEALESMMDLDEGTTRRERIRPVSMDEQMAYLRELYAAGFQDEAYAEHHRGDGRARPLKRHRDPLVLLAQEHLSKAAMRRAMSAEDFTAIHRGANAVVSSTDLVSAKERKLFAAMEASHHEAFADSLHALLYGTSKLIGRVDGFVATLDRALGQSPSWELATLLLGTVHVSEHVVVRERVFSLQSEWTAPGLGVSSRPMGLLYERLRAMAVTVRDQLKEAGFEPRDLLDVGDFMWVTRKPKAQARVEELRRERGLDMPKTVETQADAAESEAA